MEPKPARLLHPSETKNDSVDVREVVHERPEQHKGHERVGDVCSGQRADGREEVMRGKSRLDKDQEDGSHDREQVHSHSPPVREAENTAGEAKDNGDEDAAAKSQGGDRGRCVYVYT